MNAYEWGGLLDLKGKNVWWQGVIIGDKDECHNEYKKMAARIRQRGFNARTRVLPDTSWNGAVARTLIIMPKEQAVNFESSDLYKDCLALQKKFWG